jgi:hypothetical protein
LTETLCQLCQAPIIVARIAAGRTGYKSIMLERCAEGAGRIAIFPTLFAEVGPLLAEEVVNGTSFRPHQGHCGRPSHSAGSFKRKVKDRSSVT